MIKMKHLIIGLGLLLAVGCSKDSTPESMATKAEFTGYRTTLTRGTSITHIYDFSKNYKIQTQIFIKDAESEYDYELKLVGRTLNDVFTVALEELEIPTGGLISGSKSISVSPTQPNLTDKTIYKVTGFDELNLSADYYDVWLVEKNSGNEIKVTPYDVTLNDNIDFKIKDSDVSNFMQITNPITIITERDANDYFYPSPRPSKTSVFKFVTYTLEGDKVDEMNVSVYLIGNYIYRFNVYAIVKNLNLTSGSKYYYQFESTDGKYKSLPEFVEIKQANVVKVGEDI